jgi:hypothetical protein
VYIEDISPKNFNTTIDLSPSYQSVSGRSLCVATNEDGTRVYVGGHSGVWRSDDSGLHWRHMERPQPPPQTVLVPNALMVPNVYDIRVSKANKDSVLVATGRDNRSPTHNGVYHSLDGGESWKLVHQFAFTVGVNPPFLSVGCLAFAPDNPDLAYAAGQSALGISEDGGMTWREVFPQTNRAHRVNHVVVGPLQGSTRRIYAVGNHVWYSSDNGNTWRQDPGQQNLGFPGDGPGPSSRALAIHPTDPTIIYLIQNGMLWRGDFSMFDASGAATWTQLASIPIGYPGTTASGADYIVPHVDPEGRFFLFASDRRTSNVFEGEPTSDSDWKRIDAGLHLDPHNLVLTPNFQMPTASGFMPLTKSEKLINMSPVASALRGPGIPGDNDDPPPLPEPTGIAYVVNDGGVYRSNNGGLSWFQGHGLTTLGLVNLAVLPIQKGKEPGICTGMGDNSGFFSPDGGATWRTQDYVGGDNDACFADTRQPSRLIVFAPRFGMGEIFLYVDPAGNIPNGAIGTNQRTRIPGPPTPPSSNRGWNAVSGPFNSGNRPIILTTSGEEPLPGGDFIIIIYFGQDAILSRTTKLDQITDPNDWITNATADGPNVKVFKVGPILPQNNINVVQASGGHSAPVYYVGNPDSNKRLWKWTEGMNDWQMLVPGPAVGGTPFPLVANRFFASPYDPNIIYILDAEHILRSDDGGDSWVVDTNLEKALTEDFSFPFDAGYDGNPGQSLLRDMQFASNDPGLRFAVGPAGVFYTENGVDWDHVFRTSAMPMRPNNAIFDHISDPCDWLLFVATNNFGVLKIRPNPPLGSILASEGKISLLRVHDVGSKYGPPDDQLDVEVVVWLDTEEGKAFGFQYRRGAEEKAHKGMLDVLRNAFNKDVQVRIEYERTGCNNNRIIRVAQLFKSREEKYKNVKASKR